MTQLENYCDQGYMEFTTPYLSSKEYFIFWKSLQKSDFKEEIIDFDYLSKLSEILEKDLKQNLFGLDFLFDFKENLYYLIDINFFPTYKEIKSKFPQILKSHIRKISLLNNSN